MKKIIRLPFLNDLEGNLSRPSSLIQIVVGPRQVGKTTGIKQLLNDHDGPHHYASADGLLSKNPEWLEEQWLIAKQMGPASLLVIDEVQKIENWSEVIKLLFDSERDGQDPLKIVLLGSSSLSIMIGANESLAGRFQLHRVFQWNFEESRQAYGLNFEQYLAYGGYPASYAFIDEHDTWLDYLRTSIIDTVIGKDILSLVRVKSPALFRQCFDLICSYPAQEISYSKLLGQLQEKGNTDLIKNYIEHFEGAFLVKQLFKYSAKPTLRASSSPKILPLCPAFYTAMLGETPNQQQTGHAFEVIVGMALNRKPGKLFYWREKSDEVDFVYVYGRKITAIEVKSSRRRSQKGLKKFQEKFPGSDVMLITPENYEAVLARL